MAVQEKLLEYRRSEPQAWNQVRLIVSNAVEVAPDRQGRILVPGGLQEAASLSYTVLLSGNLDRIELWDPKTYAEAVQDQAGDLQQFAHRLCG